MVPFHTSVMLSETLSFLAPRKDGELMIDATLGEGGHTEAFLERFQTLSVIGLDADPVIQARARERLSRFEGRMDFYLGYYDGFFESCAQNGKHFDTVLFDLGISMFHFEGSARGFSFRKDEELDMRLSPNAERSAKDLVNTEKEEDLANIIFNYGEERYSRRIAKAIVEARKKAKIYGSTELAEIIYKAVPADYRHGRVHPATKTFQALRIAVNSELERIQRSLEFALDALNDDGRIGVITFHSLEDRIVKQFFKEKNKACTCGPEKPICTCGGKRVVEILTRKALLPSEAEISRNSASRSAKFRVVRKCSSANP